MNLKLLDVGHTIQMAGAIYASADRNYLCFFPEDDPKLPTEVVHMTAEEWSVFLRQTDLLEVEVLAKAEDGSLAKAIMRKSQRQIDQGVSWKVFRRDAYACRYCGLDDVPLTVDHVICWEDGGPSIESNLVSACRKCNKVRGNTPFEEWLRHPRYRELSKKLKPEIRARNEALIADLPNIPRMVHKRSR